MILNFVNLAAIFPRLNKTITISKSCGVHFRKNSVPIFVTIEFYELYYAELSMSNFFKLRYI